MELTKDTYEYLLNFADDKDVLNMLSVNKKFSDEKLFERIIKRRYPLLLSYKQYRQSYKSFFIEMVYYISKLQEDFGIPYIPYKYFNPEIFYYSYIDAPEYFLNGAASVAAEAGRLDLVKMFIDKGAKEISLISAARGGNLDIVKLAKGRGSDINVALGEAAERGYLDIVKFLIIEKGASDIETALDLSKYMKNQELVDYLETLI
jgi:ankyrin repeat protein